MTALKLNTNILMLGDFTTLKKGIMLINFEQNTINEIKKSGVAEDIATGWQVSNNPQVLHQINIF
jgi:hypothetical protein